MEHQRETFYQDNKSISLYPGIDLSYVEIVSDFFPLRHEPSGNILQISYCRSGQIAWEIKDGESLCLNPGDFSVCLSDVCADASVHLPAGQYRGLAISVDLQKAAAQPPELIAGTGLFDGPLREKFSGGDTIIFPAGDPQTESIFSAFYGQPEPLRLCYQRLKTLELLLCLAQAELPSRNRLTEFRAEQIETVRMIHDRLLEHLEDRITIEELSRRYLIDTTTLKAAFKEVYGTSLAAHIKTHRMERAARLLRETGDSVAEIAAQVGYESQSRFTAAFKEVFQVLPTVYRRLHGK